MTPERSLIAGALLPPLHLDGRTGTVRELAERLPRLDTPSLPWWVLFPDGDRGLPLDICCWGPVRDAYPAGARPRTWPALPALRLDLVAGPDATAIERLVARRLRADGLRRAFSSDLWELGHGGGVLAKHWSVEVDHPAANRAGGGHGRRRRPQRPWCVDAPSTRR